MMYIAFYGLVGACGWIIFFSRGMDLDKVCIVDWEIKGTRRWSVSPTTRLITILYGALVWIWKFISMSGVLFAFKIAWNPSSMCWSILIMWALAYIEWWQQVNMILSDTLVLILLFFSFCFLFFCFFFVFLKYITYWHLVRNFRSI